jgi:hypothetical protein
MNNILPVHQKIAELWIINQGRELTESEMKEMYICMKANANMCWELAYLQNISLMASMTNDIDWQHEISLEIDQM